MKVCGYNSTLVTAQISPRKTLTFFYLKKHNLCEFLLRRDVFVELKALGIINDGKIVHEPYYSE